MRIGRLIDHPTTAGGGADYGRRALDLVFDATNAAGGIAGEPIEVIEVDAVGSVERVCDGARRLAADGCVMILGPAVTHFAVPLVPVLDDIQVPGINWAGSALARGAWDFQLKVGSLPDEAGHLTRLLAARGYRDVAVARDRGPIGDEYAAFLRGGLDACGIAVSSDVVLDEAGEYVDALRKGNPACVLYLGLGPRGVALCAAVRRSGWTIPIIGNIGIGVRPSPEVEGVVFTDVVDEANPVLQRFVRRYEERHGPAPLLLGLAAGHDLAMTAVEALRLAPSMTAAGARAGLEQLRGVPAAVGGVGTTIGFGPFDRDGYKGPLVVYREIRGGVAVDHRL